MSTTTGNQKQLKVTDPNGNVWLMTLVDRTARDAIDGARMLNLDEDYFLASLSQDGKQVNVGLNGVPIGIDSDSPLKFVQDTQQGIVFGSDAPFATAIAPEYDATATYPTVGTAVMYKGLRYVSNTAINTAEEWNASHWTLRSVEEDLDNSGTGSIVFPEGNYCIGYWGNKTCAQKDEAFEKKIFGDRDWLLDWRPYLIDMTPVQGEVAKVPVAELKKDNWLRKVDNTYATVCGITPAQSTACDVQLYWDSAHTNAISSSFYENNSFKPAAFWEYCKLNLSTINSYAGVTYNTPIEVNLYDASGNKFSYGSYTNYHIVAPWETTNVNLSVYIGRPDDVYLIDRVVGDSGKEWTGILANEEEFDGIDPSFFKLKRTGISPGCSTAKYVNGRYCLRNFFYNYAAGTTMNSSTWGTSDMSAMANGSSERSDDGSSYHNDSGYNNGIFWNNGHYPISMYRGYNDYGPHLKTAEIYARNNNYADSGSSFVDSPIPVSEGGYHSNNTFLCCMETAFGTKFLDSNNMFSAGISSNYECSNDDEWELNGGIKYVYGGTTYYNKWNDTCAYNTSWNWSCTMNSYHAKFQCNEPQIAASLATEMGLSDTDSFVWNGGTWSFKKPTKISNFNINTLGQGEMNCRIYKKINFIPSSYTGYNVTLNLVCGLIEGVDFSGDILSFTNGGCELVCISDSQNSSYTSYPVVLNVFLETNQSKWHTEDFYNNKDGSSTSLSNYFYLPRNYTFNFENSYKKIADGTTTSGYTRRKASYAPCASELIAGYQQNDDLDIGGSKGDCFYSNTRIADYSTTGCGYGYRHRKALRLRGSANSAHCSPRYLVAHFRAACPGCGDGCVAQVLLAE